jgi:glutathione S-transferase
LDVKLFFTPLPGYSQRVEIVAREAGVYDRIEIIPTNPFESPEALVAANPLSKVPTLVRDDGVPMFGGPVIYEYLDSFNTGTKLYPVEPNARWEALRIFGLGEGMFDAADLRVVELRREEGQKSQDWIARYQRAVDRSLDRLNEEAKKFTSFHIGHISVAGALMWFDYLKAAGRGDQTPWRPNRPVLAAWYEETIKRPSFKKD